MKPVLLVLALMLSATCTLGQTAVSTFECIGLYYSPTGGSPTKPVTVRYKPESALEWKQGHQLWYDDEGDQYRGSIVGLDPGVTYDIELTFEQIVVSLQASTRSEIIVPTHIIEIVTPRYEPLVIQGSSGGGYTLYRPKAGQSGIIDVVSVESLNCIEIRSSYVIVQGFTLRGGIEDAILIKANTHDVIVERCDISNWGRDDYNSGGSAIDAGIEYAATPSGVTFSGIVIQRNLIHDPRGDGIPWTRPPNPIHAKGAAAIYFKNPSSGNVIRYNEICSKGSPTRKYFLDGINGAEENMSGSPGMDSDIYGNYIAHCWDDGIEAEGNGANVRIWGNFVDSTFIKIAIAPVSAGPMYIFRNIAGNSKQYNDDIHPNGYGRGHFIKAGTGPGSGGPSQVTGGTYVYHNTVLQRELNGDHLGSAGSIMASGGANSKLNNLTSRNNILQRFEDEPSAPFFVDGYPSCETSNSLNFDLYRGDMHTSCSGVHEVNGIDLQDDFAPLVEGYVRNANGNVIKALITLTEDSDEGTFINNFNDGAIGNPDMGAFETGSTTYMEFGVNAYLGLSKVENGSSSDQQRSATLLQNHPNPLNPSTRIRFSISSDNRVELKVFNTLGQEIATLVDQVMRSGAHEVMWNGTDGVGKHLPSGVYYVRMRVDNAIETRKLVLLR